MDVNDGDIDMRFLLIIILVIYDWFERETNDEDKYHGHQYKLGLTKQQYDQMKSMVSPLGKMIFVRFDSIVFVFVQVRMVIRYHLINFAIF